MDMSRATGAIQRFGEGTGDLLLEAVDKGVNTRWEPARERAAKAAGATLPARVAEVRKMFAQELGLVGAGTGGAGAVPGVGTAAVLATAAGDIAWTTVRLADLVLTIAHLHGHDKADVEERRMWVLAVLAGGATATRFAEKLATEAGKGLGAKATAAVSTQMIQQFNRAMGRTIVTKYGTKRGAVALGKALPFGIGALIGGGFNYGTVRVVSRTADRFFALLPGLAQPN